MWYFNSGDEFKILPPGQMVVPVTTIMAKGTINGDHRRP